MNPLERLRTATAQREIDGLRRRPKARTPDHDGLIDLASNDYLGLSRDPRVIEGAVRAAREWGGGSTGSRLVTGTTELHTELDGRLAAFTGAQAGLTLSSGYLANLGAVTALSGPGTLVISDQVNHASIVDACRLSRARVAVAPHRNVAAVAELLAARTEEYAIVVTDAVFSVDGDLAPLAELHQVVRTHGAFLIIDEAHAMGVVGDEGRGAAHQAGLAGEPDVVLTLTLSKSFAAQGGAVLGAPEVIETMIDTARAFIFDTGLNPAAAGAALAALDVIELSPELPARARAHARLIAKTAESYGLESAVPAAAVVPVFLGEPHKALRAAEICAEQGLRVGCFRPPSVPQGRACLRLTARASLTETELKGLDLGLLTVAREFTP